ncbi:CHAT domain-containing protein [Marinactinospora endophytica]
MVLRIDDEVTRVVALVGRDPARAHRHATRLLAEQADPRIHSIALRALGLAQHEMGDPAAAQRSLLRAVTIARRSGARALAAQAHVTRLGLLARRGGGRGLDLRLDRAARPDPSARALALLNRGVAACQQGLFSDALDSFDAAARHMRSWPDGRLLSGLLSNRGLALMHAGRLSAAADDLEQALALTREHGLDYLGGLVLHNLGCVEVVRGDVGAAMNRFAAASPLLPGSRLGALALDRANALVAAGLFRDAATLIRRAAASCETEHRDSEFAVRRLLEAKVHLNMGDRDTAVERARRVREAFPPHSSWAGIARQVEWAARFAPSRRIGTPHAPRPGPTGRTGLRSQTQPADAVRTEAPAVSGPRPDTHGDGPVLSEAPPPEWPRDLPATADAGRALALRIATTPLGGDPAPGPFHAAALRALAEDRREVARQVLERGLSREAGPPLGCGHVELVAHARPAGHELAGLGARISLEDGDAATALEFLEWRPASSPDSRCHDTGWAALLDRYRSAHDQATAGDVSARRELGRLSLRLGLARWHAACAARPLASPWASGTLVARLAGELGSRAFVRYAEDGRGPVAITLVAGRVRAHRLPDSPDRADAVAKLLHAARLGVVTPSTAADALTEARAALVQRLLVDPIGDAIGGRPLVVVPPPEAHALPWGVLPGLRGLPVSVVPSARTWLACRSRPAPSPPGRPLIVAGPGLAGAEDEIRALSRLLPGATVLSGAAATADAVLRGLGAADIAHLGAHGMVPMDAPMRSGLLLNGGPLFAYDMERPARLPWLTVLSSCGLGQSVSSPTGVPLGLVSTVLARGGRTVIASMLPVRDRGAGRSMAALYAALLAGTPPAQAVADHLSEAGFVCFGAG